MPIKGKVNKSKYPLFILQIIEELISKIVTNHEVSFSQEGFPIKISPLDNPYGFYFSINGFKMVNSEYWFAAEHCPYKGNGSHSSKIDYSLNKFNDGFTRWKNEYEQYYRPSVLDGDPTSQYQEEYLHDFLITDEDAEKTYFSHEQQHLLQGYLQNMMVELAEFKNDSNREQIDEILKDAQSLADTVSSETKNGFMRRLTRVWAKIKRMSLKVADYFTTQFIDYVTEKGIDKMVHFAAKELAKGVFYIEGAKLLGGALTS